jgi:hypothetical protein
VAEAVAQDEGAHAQALRVRRHPRIGRHGFEHRRRLGARWGEMVHAGHAREARHFGGLGALDDVVHAEAHLRQVEPELDRGGHGRN